MEENRTIMEFLRDYDKKKSIRFHMPGHKGKNLDFIKDIFPSLDITEINRSDNLHFPEGIIKNSEEKAAKVYNSKEALFMVNGSTSSIYSAITGVVKPGEKIIMQRDSHKSAYNALALGDIEAEYIYPEYDEELQINLGIMYESIEDDLKRYLEDSRVRALFLTHPNYYGICSDLEKIIDLVHSYDKIVIVDEAHGSHLFLDERLPKSAIEYGADIVIHSVHKTMMGLTQTSILHICSDRIDIDLIRSMARVYQSSSPSYILMASLDLNTDYILKFGRQDMRRHIDSLEEIIYDNIPKKDILILDKSTIVERGFKFDITKINFSIKNYSGKFIEDKLREDYNIQLEMSDHRYGVAISTPSDRREDLIDLKEAIIDIASKEYIGKDNIFNKENIIEDLKKLNLYQRPIKKIDIRKAFNSKKEELDYLKANGRISGDIIAPYPPGIPILVYGEEINDKIIRNLSYIKNKGINIEGMDGEKIKLIME